ncbi:hypothetical protein [Alkalilimnicola ehrlichii]|uniref:hypothetical protein n=1 Tax=Alkalilimnicola ehrlichii TaxID=351052 RepID=UPI000E2F7068|nr:hypothetical protein [Alkalilimnicola ehrlichii]
MKHSLQWSRVKRALGFARAQRWLVAVILFLTLLVAAANALEPLVMKYIFDGLGEAGTVATILTGVLLLGGLIVFREIANGFPTG